MLHDLFEMRSCILVVALLPLLQTPGECASLGETLDVNNVLRLEPDDKDGFLPYGTLNIEVRGDARGIPIIEELAGPNVTEFCCEHWYHDGWELLDPVAATFSNTLLDANTNMTEVWALKNATGELRSTPGPVNKGSNVCITLLVRLPENTTLSAFARLPGAAHETRIAEIKGTRSSSWIVRRFERKGSRSFRNKQLELVLRANQQDSDDSILIQWASFCSSNEEVNTYSLPSQYTPDNATSVFPNIILTPSLRGKVKDSVCLNGGHLDLDHNVCDCPPGFTGGVCEQGCGKNAFGTRCEGRCSMSVARNCRGVFICSKTRGCGCVSGITGNTCSDMCNLGWYGAGCNLQCGKCIGEPCDPFTGRCPKGCEGSQQPPFCEYECGHITPSASLISYAEEAAAEDFPWHAGIYMKQKEGDPQIKCGGTLVRPKYIISAAHCFYLDVYMKVSRAEQFAVGFGKTFNEWDAPEAHMERVQFRDVSSIHLPDLYRGLLLSYSNDIALVKLALPVDITPFVVPICFDWNGGYEIELEDGDLGTVVGWGKTEDTVTSHTLQKAELPYVPKVDCLDLLPSTFQRFVTDDKFCVGKNGGAVVNRGDSGGGLIVRQGASWFLRGIVSVGLPDQTPFTVYTNVSHFRRWIVSTWNQLDIEDAVNKEP